MSEETTSEHAHDEHHEHTFPGWVTLGETKSPESAFVRIFLWLVFWTIIEVVAILREFDFWITMGIYSVLHSLNAGSLVLSLCI